MADLPIQFQHIPDAEYYAPFSIQPIFSPHLGYDGFNTIWDAIQPFTLVSNDRCYSILQFLKQALNLEGEVWECGVYHGGTAMLINQIAKSRVVRLFDTFEGMPKADEHYDTHKQGDFNDALFEDVVKRVQGANVYKGFIPETFKGLEKSKIAFSHIDVDIYKSVFACSEFIYQRTVSGGIMLYDDCGFPSCAGARKSVDVFFKYKKEKPIYLTTGQVLIIKL